MVTKKLFRRHQADENAMHGDASATPALTPCQEKILEYEEHLSYLSQQKELHTLALKEMYQFLCKLDSSFRAENQKLRDLIKIEQERSAKLIEVTKGLWEILDLIDSGRKEESPRLAGLTRDVEDLARMEKEVAEKTEHTALDFPHIKNILPMMEAVN
jgi:hypothetical protein